MVSGDCQCALPVAVSCLEHLVFCTENIEMIRVREQPTDSLEQVARVVVVMVPLQ